MRDNPVLVEVTRGNVVESRHRGAFVVCDASGRIVHSAGDAEMAIYPRSASKPLQALPLIETGAADRFGLGDREIALACASHKGEPTHVEAVGSWLAKIGLSPESLECGTQIPRTEAAFENVIRNRTPVTPVFHNCSGKHTGFLTTCVTCGDGPEGYIEPDHPAQRRVTAALSEMTGVDMNTVPLGRDGCGIPVYFMPLRGLARGMARLADTTTLPTARAQAATRILDAMAAEPFYVNGSGGFTTEVMMTARKTVRAKGGFEGVYSAALPTLGLGVALKIDDGAMRGAECAMAHILLYLNCFSADQEWDLDRFLRPSISTNVSLPVGVVRPTKSLEFSSTL